MIRKLLEKISTENPRPVFITLRGILLVSVIGIIDFFTGYQISFSIFYLIPILMITWQGGKTAGIAISLLSAITWLWADLLADHFYTHLWIPYWNAIMRLGFFILVTCLLGELKNSLINERRLARIDHLTQVANSRAFMEILNLEFIRARRYKHRFTLAYLDLDNFKQVNDQFGHERGDHFLQNISRIMMKQIRQIDQVGRLGGDEFAILLPETDKPAAMEVLYRIHRNWQKVIEEQGLPVTLSIGCVTFIDLPETADELITMVDKLMYTVKNSTKNDIRCEEFRRQATAKNQ